MRLLSQQWDLVCGSTRWGKAMIDSLFVMTEGGDVLIEKHSRRRHSRAVCEKFFDHVRKEARPEDTCPVIATPECYLIHIFRYKLFFLAALDREAPPMMVIEFLQRTVEVLYDYFGGPVNEVVMKDNFVTVYSVLDEMLDNGYPLITELNILQEMVKPKSTATRIADAISVSGHGASKSTGELPGGAMSDVPWRKAGVKYSNNELFFDIIEEIDGTMDWCALTIVAHN
eukprot:COSAG02_NODE_1152_length_14201_cov_9.055595_13_plen_228_part_00